MLLAAITPLAPLTTPLAPIANSKHRVDVVILMPPTTTLPLAIASLVVEALRPDASDPLTHTMSAFEIIVA